jgi:hypothetical protein
VGSGSTVLLEFMPSAEAGSVIAAIAYANIAGQRVASVEPEDPTAVMPRQRLEDFVGGIAL